MECITHKTSNLKIKIKSSLYSLNTPFSGVTSEQCPSLRLCTKAHIIKVAMVASCWQRMGDLIGSGFEPYTSRTRSERLTLVLSGRITSKLFKQNQLFFSTVKASPPVMVTFVRCLLLYENNSLR